MRRLHPPSLRKKIKSKCLSSHWLPKKRYLQIQEDAGSEGDLAAKGQDSDDSGAGDAPAGAAGAPKTRSGKGKAPNPNADGTDRPIVVDASNHVAGRLSSLVAKMLLKGNRISLVNCERIMISGTRSNTIHEYRQFLKINSIINPKHGPVHYRRPDTVITKMKRGMLPFEKKPSGKTSHKRLARLRRLAQGTKAVQKGAV